MTREEFFDALWQMLKFTDVDYECIDDDGEGGVYIKFTNVVEEEEMA